MNLKIYQPIILKYWTGFMTPKEECTEKHYTELTNPILKAWLNDDDIQELRLVSTNIGWTNRFVKQYQK